ncbi:hypothetical protein HNP84_000415 [Thermocatellispora tengchongensis]|uniref:Uncharacterized protein n=1 Tax=Thermocatellispora tengchongensis TaxID=1073253 RepID=A0A840P0D2_9ACTN|nr:hypothetical protein [Thermocatellispora tengchongensis]
MWVLRNSSTEPPMVLNPDTIPTDDGGREVPGGSPSALRATARRLG